MRTGQKSGITNGRMEIPPLPATMQAVATPREAAREKREALLKSERWLGSAEVAGQASGQILDGKPDQYAGRLRREKQLFGVRVGGPYLHPAFQFLPESGELHPKLNALLAKLPHEDHGWAAALWLFAPTRKLDGARPADIFQANPDAVIDAARATSRATMPTGDKTTSSMSLSRRSSQPRSIGVRAGRPSSCLVQSLATTQPRRQFELRSRTRPAWMVRCYHFNLSRTADHS